MRKVLKEMKAYGGEMKAWLATSHAKTSRGA